VFYTSLTLLKVTDFLPSLHWSEKENLRLKIFVIEGLSSNQHCNSHKRHNSQLFLCTYVAVANNDVKS